MKVLIIEDEKLLADSIQSVLERKGFEVECVYDGETGAEYAELGIYDLLILDVMMPKMDGYEFVRALRESSMDIPVIMLTAMNTFAHKKEGYASGIDDYMTKPIQYEELEWHIEALLRRARIANDNKITVGALVLDRDSMSAKYEGTDIPLTAKEFDLLYKFLSYPEVVFTKQQLMDELWGYDTETDYNTIKTYVSRLRSKFSHCPEFELVALRGLGYKAIIHREGN